MVKKKDKERAKTIAKRPSIGSYRDINAGFLTFCIFFPFLATKKITGSKFADHSFWNFNAIASRHTDISFEDLALHFLVLTA